MRCTNAEASARSKERDLKSGADWGFDFDATTFAKYEFGVVCYRSVCRISTISKPH